MISRLVPEISPLDAFCDVVVVGVGVGIGDSRSWIKLLGKYKVLLYISPQFCLLVGGLRCVGKNCIDKTEKSKLICLGIEKQPKIKM